MKKRIISLTIVFSMILGTCPSGMINTFADDIVSPTDTETTTEESVTEEILPTPEATVTPEATAAPETTEPVVQTPPVQNTVTTFGYQGAAATRSTATKPVIEQVYIRGNYYILDLTLDPNPNLVTISVDSGYFTLPTTLAGTGVTFDGGSKYYPGGVLDAAKPLATDNLTSVTLSINSGIAGWEKVVEEVKYYPETAPATPQKVTVTNDELTLEPGDYYYNGHVYRLVTPAIVDTDLPLLIPPVALGNDENFHNFVEYAYAPSTQSDYDSLGDPYLATIETQEESSNLMRFIDGSAFAYVGGVAKYRDAAIGTEYTATEYKVFVNDQDLNNANSEMDHTALTGADDAEKRSQTFYWLDGPSAGQPVNFAGGYDDSPWHGGTPGNMWAQMVIGWDGPTWTTSGNGYDTLNAVVEWGEATDPSIADDETVTLDTDYADYYVSSNALSSDTTGTGTASNPYKTIKGATDAANLALDDNVRILVMDDNVVASATPAAITLPKNTMITTADVAFGGAAIPENTVKKIIPGLVTDPMFSLTTVGGTLIFEDIEITGNNTAKTAIQATNGTVEMQDSVLISGFKTAGTNIVDISGTAQLVATKDGTGAPLAAFAPVEVVNATLDSHGPIFYGNTINDGSILSITGSGISDINYASFGVSTSSGDFSPWLNRFTGGVDGAFIKVSGTTNEQKITNSQFTNIDKIAPFAGYSTVVDVASGGKLALKDDKILRYYNTESIIRVATGGVLTADALKLGSTTFDEARNGIVDIAGGSATFTNSTIESTNTSQANKHLVTAVGGTLNMTDTVIKNCATAAGGHIMDASAGAVVTLDNVDVISGNKSDHTIYIKSDSGNFTMKNTDVTGNELKLNDGKAVYNDSTKLYFDGAVNINNNEEVTPDPATDNNLWLPTGKNVVLKSVSGGTVKFDTQEKPNIQVPATRVDISKVIVAIADTAYTVGDTDKTKFEYFVATPFDGVDDIVDGTGAGGTGAKLVLTKAVDDAGAPTLSGQKITNTGTVAATTIKPDTDLTWIQSPIDASQDAFLEVTGAKPVAETQGELSFVWYEDTNNNYDPLVAFVPDPADTVAKADTAVIGDTSSVFQAKATNTTTAPVAKKYYCVVTNTNSGSTGQQTASVGSKLYTVTTNNIVDVKTPIITTNPAALVEGTKGLTDIELKLVADNTLGNQGPLATTTSPTPTQTATSYTFVWYSKPYDVGNTVPVAGSDPLMQGWVVDSATATTTGTTALDAILDIDDTIASDKSYFCVVTTSNTSVDGLKDKKVNTPLSHGIVKEPKDTIVSIDMSPLTITVHDSDINLEYNLYDTVTGAFVDSQWLAGNSGDVVFPDDWTNAHILELTPNDRYEVKIREAGTTGTGIVGVEILLPTTLPTTAVTSTQPLVITVNDAIDDWSYNVFDTVTGTYVDPEWIDGQTGTTITFPTDWTLAHVLSTSPDDRYRVDLQHDDGNPNTVDPIIIGPTVTVDTSDYDNDGSDGNGGSGSGGSGSGGSGSSGSGGSVSGGSVSVNGISGSDSENGSDSGNVGDGGNGGIVSPDETGVSDYLSTATNTEGQYPFMVGEGNMFRPNEDITRGEVAQIFYNLMLDKNLDTDNMVEFSDVSADMWYSDAVNVMASKGFIKGYPDGSFKPNKPITRAEFVTIATAFAEDTNSTISFPDVPSTHWANEYIQDAVYYGWINGYEDGTFKPNQNITRAEATVVADNMLWRTPDKAAIDAMGEDDFADVDSSHWAYYYIIEATHIFN